MFLQWKFPITKKAAEQSKVENGAFHLSRIGTGNTGPGNYIGQGRVQYRTELVGRLLIILSS